MPHIMHIASVLYIDEKTIKKIYDLFLNILWSGRKHVIAKTTIIQPISNSGLKMICIKKK